MLKWLSNNTLYNSYSIDMYVFLWIAISIIFICIQKRKSDILELLMNLNSDAEKFFVVFLR